MELLSAESYLVVGAIVGVIGWLMAIALVKEAKEMLQARRQVIIAEDSEAVGEDTSEATVECNKCSGKGYMIYKKVDPISGNIGESQFGCDRCDGTGEMDPERTI